MSYDVYNIYDMIDTIGEEELQSLLSEFSCPKNAEIESFVRYKAIDLAKRKAAITYLIMDCNGSIAGMFALTHKSITVTAPGFSASMRKRLARYSHYDAASDTYTASSFLIAQFGKNYAPDAPDISGDYMMDCAIETLQAAQRLIGGGVVYLECEESIPRLKDFYGSEHNRFVEFGFRLSDSAALYRQMMRIL